MKIATPCIALYACLCLPLAGCLPAQTSAPVASSQLTPYLTTTPPPAAATTAQATETVLPGPSATPEPLIHEVALEETISLIALRYGVSMDAIIEANPDVDPRTLTVGTRLLIPGVSPAAQLDPDAASLALEVGEVGCLPTPEGGLWCHALVRNPLGQPADGLIVTFTVTDQSGGETLRQNVPALLNRIDPGGTLPAIAYFPPPAPRVPVVAAELLSALPLEAAIRTYVDISLQNERSVLQSRSARASTQLVLPAGDESAEGETLNIWIAAAAYDAQGRLVGVRRLEHTLQAGEATAQNPLEVTLLVYSASGEIDSLRLSAEAFIFNQ